MRTKIPSTVILCRWFLLLFVCFASCHRQPLSVHVHYKLCAHENITFRMISYHHMSHGLTQTQWALYIHTYYLRCGECECVCLCVEEQTAPRKLLRVHIKPNKVTENTLNARIRISSKANLAPQLLLAAVWCVSAYWENPALFAKPAD